MKSKKNKNIVWQETHLTKDQRAAIKNQLPAVLWFTGLPSSGKSTLANALEVYLHELGCHTMLLDGDNVRHGLCSDLNFSKQDRKENIRRIAEVAKLYMESGLIVITAFISPYKVDREQAKKIIGDQFFYEIYCHCPIDICEKRDPKGLYKQARLGEIQEFTGISSPYEAPSSPKIVIDNFNRTVESSLSELDRKLNFFGVLNSDAID